MIAEHLADLGGVDNTSAAERSIIRRVSTLTVELKSVSGGRRIVLLTPCCPTSWVRKWEWETYAGRSL